MKRFKAVFAILILLVFVSGCEGPSFSPVSGGVQSAGQSSGTLWPTKNWSVCSPAKQGLNADMLAKADRRISDNYPNVYSLLVVRHGSLAYEKYYNGMGRDDANPVYSVTKSVLSALTGIAVREKLIRNVDESMEELLPAYFTNADERKKKITVENVLTMTGGLESIDNNYGAYYTSEDWMEYALSKPLTDQPGTKFVYNTGLIHFLSVAITQASGMSTKDFAQKYLFSKIGMSVSQWDKDGAGHFGGGTGLWLTPRDMAKLGYLYLNQGNWDGEQVVPKEWAAESVRKHIAANKDADYGYLFWLQTMRDPVGGKSYSTFRADGAGGQKIIVVPELDMVAVVTANVRSASKDGEDTQNIVSDYVFPAVTDAKKE